MKKQRRIAIALAVLLMTAAGAIADWMIGDPYKMHFPQLPVLSPLGVDVLDGPSSPFRNTRFLGAASRRRQTRPDELIRPDSAPQTRQGRLNGFHRTEPGTQSIKSGAK